MAHLALEGQYLWNLHDQGVLGLICWEKSFKMSAMGYDFYNADDMPDLAINVREMLSKPSSSSSF